MQGKTKKFGFLSIVLLTVNAIIGTGIFLSPAGVVKRAGIYTPFIYLLAAIFAAILALTFAAAAKYTEKNGAAYAYAKMAFGDNIGFYVGITRFTAGAIAWGAMGTAVVRTSLGILGGRDAVNNFDISLGFLVLMTILLLIIFSGTHITKIFSNISTIGKVGALLIAIIAGLIILFMNDKSHFYDLTGITDDQGQLLIPSMNSAIFVSALLSAFYAYIGFESVALAASEMVSPEKNLPRAIPMGMAIIAFIYIGVVTITMSINPVALLKSDEPVLLAAVFANPWIKRTIIYGALLSMFGINITAAFSTPRLFEAMVQEGQLPKFLNKKTKRGLPIFAFIITAFLAITIPMSFNYDMRDIMIITSVSPFIQFLIVPLALFAVYFGYNKEEVLPAKKNVVTDLAVPALAFILSAVLMMKFNWRGAFSVDDQLNLFAIGATILGYIILPLLLFIPLKLGMYNKK